MTADPNILEQVWSAVSPHASVGSLGVMGTMVLCTRYIVRTAKPLLQWARVHIEEHDLMWEDYCKRHNIRWNIKRIRGRGVPAADKAAEV